MLLVSNGLQEVQSVQLEPERSVPTTPKQTTSEPEHKHTSLLATGC